jgi:hypothetical protein
MIGVFSGGMSPPVDFWAKDGEVEGMITGAPAEPSSSSLHPISLDESCPAGVELHEYFCKVVGVQFAGLVIWVPSS